MTAGSVQGSPSRNAPCPCGSGKKYKRCCGRAAGKQTASSPPPDGLHQVIRLYQQGNLQAAGQLAEQLLNTSPDDAGLLEITAAVALQSGNILLAVERFRQQARLQPDNALAHSNLCMALHTLGQDEEAFRSGQKAVKLDPKLADAWNNLGNIFKSGNHLEGARDHYAKALAIDHNDPKLLVNAGAVNQLLGDLDTAERHYRDALQLQPGFIPAWNNLATVLQKQQRHDEAETTFRHALDLQPSNPETLTNYGSFLLERMETDGARGYFEQAIQADPEYAGAWISMGNLYDRLDDQDNAQKYYDKALLLDPENSTVLCNIAYRLYELGEQQDAVDQFIRALKNNPNSAKGLAGLGKAMLRQDDMGKATEYIEKALALAPWDAHAHIANAHLLENRHENARAEAEWQWVIEQQPAMTEAYTGLANHYSAQGQHEQAREQFMTAEKNGIANLRFYHAWSQAEEMEHHLDEAERLAEKAVEYDAAYPGSRILKAKLARRRKDYAAALECLQQVDRDTLDNQLTRAGYLFELGAVHDKLGDYTAAFAAYDEANQAKNRYIGRKYQHEEDQEKFSRWQAFYSPDNWLQLSRDPIAENTTAPRPVFIVGFPRSGTSLLEQILGSHPSIAPAGELVFISDLANHKARTIIGSKLEYPACLQDADAPLDEDKVAAMRDYYLNSTRELGVTDSSTRWVTDKTPHNAIHVGLIALLFPQSPIIHISRHPLNSCLSAYFSNFKAGHRYTSSLESTAQHYKLFMEMLDHYRNIGIGFMEIHYEDLVADQESVTRGILDYIGAPWDDACLQHHKSKRVVKTASYEQVTQKVYTSSLYRYRNYRDAVQGIIPILETTIKRFGYTTD
jgi:tetratricopeptide (TPR) repeat protein